MKDFHDIGELVCVLDDGYAGVDTYYSMFSMSSRNGPTKFGIQKDFK